MATLTERLKLLGIGQGVKQYDPETIPEGFRPFEGKQNLDTEKLLQLNGKTYVGPSSPLDASQSEMRSRFPVTGTQAQASLEPPRPRFAIPGTQALANIGLFTQPNSNPTVVDPNMRGGFEGTGELTPGTTIDESGASAGPNVIDLIQDRIQTVESNNGIREGAAALSKTGEFADGTLINTSGFDLSQDPIKNTVNTLIQTLSEKAQAVKDFAEKQKQDYLDNRKKRMQVHASEMVMDMENQLMKSIMEKEKKRKQQEDLQQDYFDYMDLENQVQEANNEMDKTNFYLQHSGLFGQRRNSPSYTSVIPQSSFGPSSTYAQPEYYSGDPFEIKRLYE